jgi:hypothetical protein
MTSTAVTSASVGWFDRKSQCRELGLGWAGNRRQFLRPLRPSRSRAQAGKAGELILGAPPERRRAEVVAL